MSPAIVTTKFSYGMGMSQSKIIRFSVVGLLSVLCIYYFVVSKPSKISWSSRTLAPPLDEIPPKIWQIYTFANTKIDEFVPYLQSWITQNQDYAYTLMSDDGADAFARKHYHNRPEILQLFLDLRFPILRTDLLRYMILESEGGVYSDLDTSARRPIREWVTPELKPSVHAILGIEYDQLDDEPFIGMTERLLFCQWTIATSRGHPLMGHAVQDVVEALHAIADSYQTSISELEVTDDEVLRISGPVIWTKAVMRTLSEVSSTTVDYRNFTGMTEPRLFGDVLVLPIDAFGTGQPHSNSRKDGSGNAFVRHMFKGSWKHNWPG